MSAPETRDYASTMEILHPAPNILGFYDGRQKGKRLFSEKPNWLDDGAFTLGTCSYVIVDGDEALVYDTHISKPHAQKIRQHLKDIGVAKICVVLSHWHVDHVAGNEIFADCKILANNFTKSALLKHQSALEDGYPPIFPLVMPTHAFEGHCKLHVGKILVELHHVDAHSHDGTVIFLPESRIVLAGDTLEDTVTYVAEPDRLADHLNGLNLMSRWNINSILPNHGDASIIRNGGYSRSLIDATRRYVEKLLQCQENPELAEFDLQKFVAEDLAAGTLVYTPAYEPVHRRNLEAVCTIHKNG